MLDQLALSFALLTMLLSYYLRHHDATLVTFLGLRVSVRNVLLELGFLLTWRAIFWVMGLYQVRLIHAAWARSSGECRSPFCPAPRF